MKLRRRIAIHYLIQFFILFIASFLIVIVLLLLLVNFMTNEELKINPQKAIIENITSFTIVDNDEQVNLNAKWEKQLKKNNMWLQVINSKGEAIYEFNLPAALNHAYTINELLLIEEKGKIGNYDVESYYDTWDNASYYYLFGYRHVEQDLLTNWHKAYSKNGKIKSKKIEELTTLAKKHHGVIDVYKNGELIQTTSEKMSEDHQSWDILASLHTPGKQKTKAFIYNDETAGTSWVLNIKNDEYNGIGVNFISSEVKMLLTAIFISLTIAILFSIWNAVRYGKPLHLIIHWLGGIENRQFEAFFSEHEHRKVYRKSGKLKFRYRLYKEVIESFSKMTTKLANAEKERKQLDKTREDWMAGISHDLRTPLSSIQGYGHMMESNKYDFSKEELYEIGKVIRNKSDYMVDLLEDFSLVFKLKNSAIEIERSTVELGSYIQGILSRFEKDPALKNYAFELYKPYDSVMIESIDPKWFQRVLENLIYNAVKHNPPNTIIKVTVKENNGRPIIKIEDNGIGMDQKLVDHLFNRYYRGTNTRERSEGEGLGMSIAKAIIDLHGFDIHVESVKDLGTTITIKTD